MVNSAFILQHGVRSNQQDDHHNRKGTFPLLSFSLIGGNSRTPQIECRLVGSFITPKNSPFLSSLLYPNNANNNPIPANYFYFNFLQLGKWNGPLGRALRGKNRSFRGENKGECRRYCASLCCNLIDGVLYGVTSRERQSGPKRA